MFEISAGEAETAWESLLDRVEQGEEVIITREGKAVAKLVQPPGVARVITEEDRAAMDEAYARMRVRAKQLNLGPFDWEEYKAMRDEGRP